MFKGVFRFNILELSQCLKGFSDVIVIYCMHCCLSCIVYYCLDLVVVTM